MKIHFLKIHFKSYNGFHAHLYNPVMLKRRLQTVLTAPISPKNFDCYSSLLLLNEHHCLHKLHLQSSWRVRLISTCTKNLSLRFCFVMWCPIIGKSSNVIMSKEKAFTAKRKSKKKICTVCMVCTVCTVRMVCGLRFILTDATTVQCSYSRGQLYFSFPERKIYPLICCNIFLVIIKCCHGNMNIDKHAFTNMSFNNEILH